MRGLTFMQYRDYSEAVNIFRTVEAYNANVSTIRGNGNLGVSYYIFNSSEDETKYKQGQFILVQNDPLNANNYNPVQKN